MLRGQARRRAFQQLAHGVEFEHLGAAQLDDAEAATGAEIQDSARLQAAQRLADRGAADAQRLGDLVLADAVALLEPSVSDRLAQMLVDVLGAGRVVKRIGGFVLFLDPDRPQAAWPSFLQTRNPIIARD